MSTKWTRIEIFEKKTWSNLRKRGLKWKLIPPVSFFQSFFLRFFLLKTLCFILTMWKNEFYTNITGRFQHMWPQTNKIKIEVKKLFMFGEILAQSFLVFWFRTVFMIKSPSIFLIWKKINVSGIMRAHVQLFLVLGLRLSQEKYFKQKISETVKKTKVKTKFE